MELSFLVGAELKIFRQHLAEFLKADRFREEVIDSGSKTALPIALHGVGSESNDRCVTIRGMLATTEFRGGGEPSPADGPLCPTHYR